MFISLARARSQSTGGPPLLAWSGESQELKSLGGGRGGPLAASWSVFYLVGQLAGRNRWRRSAKGSGCGRQIRCLAARPPVAAPGRPRQSDIPRWPRRAGRRRLERTMKGDPVGGNLVLLARRQQVVCTSPVAVTNSLSPSHLTKPD